MDASTTNLSNTPTFSFEFFPAKTVKGAEALKATRTALNQLNPGFFSVTFGAAGSTRDRTVETVLEMHQEGLPTAPHISCIGYTKDQISQLLQTYQSKGINRLVALRGDIPHSDPDCVQELRYANELVAFIREQTGDYFHIEVAAYPEFHPQAAGASLDLQNFKRKVAAGANSALTQYFFNPESYYRFVDACTAEGINIPIVPGIMPITNYQQLRHFSEFCGADIPRWLDKRLADFADDQDSLIAFGIDVVSQLCGELLATGAPGLHFYTLNKLEPTRTIFSNLTPHLRN